MLLFYFLHFFSTLILFCTFRSYSFYTHCIQYFLVMSLIKAEIKSTPEHGRGVFTTCDIAPGTNVIEESPYAHAISYQCKGIICDYCSYIWSPPKPKTDEEKEKYEKNPPQMKRCSRCKLQYYCSAACQKAAWNYIHKYECKYRKD